MTVNAHRVFTNGGDDNYLAALTLEKTVEDGLRAARDKIREELRLGFRRLTDTYRRQQLFETPMAADSAPPLRPKFRMQGSFAYRTCNDPAQTPPQEIDLDDGVFLPTSFLTRGGVVHPGVVSSMYFKTVEDILEPLCAKAGWDLVKEKPSCVRVQLSCDGHIDLALYAIPDQDFEELLEKAAALNALGHDRALRAQSLRDEVELSADIYRSLSEDQIMLAHRDDGWIKSDPRKLEDWFRAALDRHGEALRRVSRYLKGWRDYEWECARLSSIALMSATVTAFDEAGKVAQDRDDKALLMVARRLPSILAARIPNPVVPGARLDEGWTLELRNEYVAAARALSDRVARALSHTDARMTLDELATAFGDRIPSDPKYVIADDGDGKISSPSVLRHGLLQDIASESSTRDAVKKQGDNRFG